jgi:hypothetical protein
MPITMNTKLNEFLKLPQITINGKDMENDYFRGGETIVIVEGESLIGFRCIYQQSQK